MNRVDERGDVSLGNGVSRVWVIKEVAEDSHTSTPQLDAGSLSEQNAGLNLNLNHSFKVAAAVLAFLLCCMCVHTWKRESSSPQGGVYRPRSWEADLQFLKYEVL